MPLSSIAKPRLLRPRCKGTGGKAGFSIMITKWQAALFGLFMGLGLCFAPVAAQVIETVDAEQLEAALSEAGLNPTMMSDSATGAPVAHGAAGDITFFVRALSCSGDPMACENLVFFANFELGRDVAPNDYRTVNSFNDSQVFGRAYVLDRQAQVGVDYVIELGGGVTGDHLSENISRWADVISAFVEKFREGQSGS